MKTSVSVSTTREVIPEAQGQRSLALTLHLGHIQNFVKTLDRTLDPNLRVAAEARFSAGRKGR